MTNPKSNGKYFDVCDQCGHREEINSIEKRRRVTERMNGRLILCPKACGGKMETDPDSPSFFGF